MPFIDLKARRKRCWQIAKRFYGHMATGDQSLYTESAKHIPEGSVILDAGCGADAMVLQKLDGPSRTRVGVSLEREYETPPGILTGCANLDRLPFRSKSFDLVTLRMVCEHLKNPQLAFTEVHRVLKDGGAAVLLTPSRWYYPCILARILPFFMHRFFIELAFGQGAYDNFPTFYRMNSVGAFHKVARESGLSVESIVTVRDYPSYLMFSPLLFRLGVVVERLIAKLGFRSLQAKFLVTLRREGGKNGA